MLTELARADGQRVRSAPKPVQSQRIGICSDGSITSQSAKAAPPSVSTIHPIATARHRNAICREGPGAVMRRLRPGGLILIYGKARRHITTQTVD